MTIEEELHTPMRDTEMARVIGISRHDLRTILPQVLPELMQRLFDWSGDNPSVAVSLRAQAQIDIEASLHGSNREVTRRLLIASIEGYQVERGPE